VPSPFCLRGRAIALGRGLVAALERHLHSQGQRVLIADTSGTESYAGTRAFYRSLGYSEEARIGDFWYAGDDKVVFRKITDLRSANPGPARSLRAGPYRRPDCADWPEDCAIFAFLQPQRAASLAPNQPRPRMPTYDNAPESLIAHWENRRMPLGGRKDGGLPPADADLSALAARAHRGPGLFPLGPRSGLSRKSDLIRGELPGASELAFVNALCIAHLRKSACPAAAPLLFRRIWVEQAPAMLAELPLRWRISSAITFAKHGQTEAERRLGQSLNILFSLIKLYEFERSFSGRAAHQTFAIARAERPGLPMGLPGFSLTTGKLDIELLAPIWADAMATPVLGPLASNLLSQLNDDEGTLFYRLNLMRRRARTRSANAGAPPAERDN